MISCFSFIGHQLNAFFESNEVCPVVKETVILFIALLSCFWLNSDLLVFSFLRVDLALEKRAYIASGRIWYHGQAVIADQNGGFSHFCHVSTHIYRHYLE